MTTISLKIPDTAPSGLAMAMAFSTQLLLPQNAPVTAQPGLANEKMKPLTIRANSLAAILKEIQ